MFSMEKKPQWQLACQLCTTFEGRNTANKMKEKMTIFRLNVDCLYAYMRTDIFGI